MVAARLRVCSQRRGRGFRSLPRSYTLLLGQGVLRSAGLETHLNGWHSFVSVGTRVATATRVKS